MRSLAERGELGLEIVDDRARLHDLGLGLLDGAAQPLDVAPVALDLAGRGAQRRLDALALGLLARGLLLGAPPLGRFLGAPAGLLGGVRARLLRGVRARLLGGPA